MLLLAAIIFAGLLFFWLHKSEPSYQGKSLSKWLEDEPVISGSFNCVTLSQETEAALQKMGTNVIPHLVERVGRKPSTFKQELSAFCWKFGLNYFPSEKYQEERFQGAVAFKAFGAEAKSAIPPLTVLLTDFQTAEAAAYALVNIGAEAIPALTNALFSNKYPAFHATAGSLSLWGTNAEQAIPALLITTTNKNPSLRAGAIEALGNIRLAPSIILPRLIAATRDKDSRVRRVAVQVIGKTGKLTTDAADVLPALMEVTADSDPDIRREAIVAIQQIDGANGFPRFIDWLGSTNSEIRGLAFRTLESPGLKYLTVRIALTNALKNTNENIRVGAMDILQRNSSPIPRGRRSP